MVTKTKEGMKMEQPTWERVHARRCIEYRMQKENLKQQTFEQEKLSLRWIMTNHKT